MTRPSIGPIERASATDRAFLAMDSGAVPEQFGVVLVLDPPRDANWVPDVTQVREWIAARCARVPRLRQRLVESPPGAGGPVWVDEPEFAVAAHVRAVACPAPGDEQALLDQALALAMVPLTRESALWSATVVTGLSGARWALVIVLHHALADGVGGLAVLGALVDEWDEGVLQRRGDLSFPRRRPTPRALYQDAWRQRIRSLRAPRRGWRQLRQAMSAAGGALPVRAAPTSLVQRTGARRHARVVHVDLEALRASVHPWGATVNDALLVVVAGALGRVQSARGEKLEEVVVTVPVSGRSADDTGAVGNMVSPLLVAVPTRGTLVERLQRVAACVRSRRAAATGPPPIALLGWLFRPVARLGGFRWYMNHQRRLHTLVSHVRGPRATLHFGGSTAVAALPLGLGEGGNITVHFEALSYAGDLAVTVIADPEHFTGLDALVGALRAELAQVLALPAPASTRVDDLQSTPPGGGAAAPADVRDVRRRVGVESTPGPRARPRVEGPDP